jgi:hypothetical protein
MGDEAGSRECKARLVEMLLEKMDEESEFIVTFNISIFQK